MFLEAAADRLVLLIHLLPSSRKLAGGSKMKAAIRMIQFDAREALKRQLLLTAASQQHDRLPSRCLEKKGGS